MDSNVVGYALQYASIIIEAALVVYIVGSRGLKRASEVPLYVLSLLVADSLRAFVLLKYGLTSQQYFYVYWSTDFLLVISAFLLVCSFFRRACRYEEKTWRLVRLLLAFVFLLVVGISGLSISRNQNDLFTYFTVEFNQNLYFTCLVLNTLLYLLLQQIESSDEQLGLLVCGVGIQFAGPAASLALLHLTAGEQFAKSLAYLTLPLCTLGMLLVWAYAITRIKGKAVQVSGSKNPILAEVTAD